jgi:hypothetical protein
LYRSGCFDLFIIFCIFTIALGGPSSTNANAIMYGTRLRLKSSFDPSSRLTSTPVSAAALAVVAALKKYGMFLADGVCFYLIFSLSPSCFSLSPPTSSFFPLFYCFCRSFGIAGAFKAGSSFSPFLYTIFFFIFPRLSPGLGYYLYYLIYLVEVYYSIYKHILKFVYFKNY